MLRIATKKGEKIFMSKRVRRLVYLVLGGAILGLMFVPFFGFSVLGVSYSISGINIIEDMFSQTGMFASIAYDYIPETGGMGTLLAMADAMIWNWISAIALLLLALFAVFIILGALIGLISGRDKHDTGFVIGSVFLLLSGALAAVAHFRLRNAFEGDGGEILEALGLSFTGFWWAFLAVGAVIFLLALIFTIKEPKAD